MASVVPNARIISQYIPSVGYDTISLSTRINTKLTSADTSNIRRLYTPTTLSTTLQSITTQNGVASPLQLSSIGIGLASPTLTGSSSLSAISVTQTWNTTGNPILDFRNVTNTASGATAAICDWQVGGVSLFRVNKISSAAVTMPSCQIGSIGFVSNNVIAASTANDIRITIPTATKALVLSNDYSSSSSTSAMLEMKSTTQGILIPRMTTTQRNAITSSSEGLMVYDLTLHKLYVFDGSIWQAAW